MKDMEQFEHWASRARGEDAPQPDVVPAVMARLRAEPSSAARGGALWALSCVAACAAAVCCVAGYRAWTVLDHPLRTWMEDLSRWGML